MALEWLRSFGWKKRVLPAKGDYEAHLLEKDGKSYLFVMFPKRFKDHLSSFESREKTDRVFCVVAGAPGVLHELQKKVNYQLVNRVKWETIVQFLCESTSVNSIRESAIMTVDERKKKNKRRDEDSRPRRKKKTKKKAVQSNTASDISSKAKALAVALQKFSCSECSRERLKDPLCEASGKCDSALLERHCGEDPAVMVEIVEYWGSHREGKFFLEPITCRGRKGSSWADLPLLVFVMLVLIPSTGTPEATRTDGVTKQKIDPLEIVNELGLRARLGCLVWEKKIANPANRVKTLWDKLFQTPVDDGPTLWDALCQNEELVRWATKNREYYLQSLFGRDQARSPRLLQAAWTRVLQIHLVKAAKSLHNTTSMEVSEILAALKARLERIMNHYSSSDYPEEVAKVLALLKEGKRITDMDIQAFVGDTGVGKSFINDAIARATSVGPHEYISAQIDKGHQIFRDAVAIAEQLIGSNDNSVVKCVPTSVQYELCAKGVSFSEGYGKREIESVEKEMAENWKKFHKGDATLEDLTKGSWIDCCGNERGSTTRCNTFWRFSPFFAVILCYLSKEKLEESLRQRWEQCCVERNNRQILALLFHDVQALRNNSGNKTRKHQYLEEVMEAETDLIPPNVSKWMGRCYVIQGRTGGGMERDRLFIRRINCHAQGLAAPLSRTYGGEEVVEGSLDYEEHGAFPLMFAHVGRMWGKRLLPALFRRVMYAPSHGLPHYGVQVDTVGFNDASALPEYHSEIIIGGEKSNGATDFFVVTAKEMISQSTLDELQKIPAPQLASTRIAHLWNAEKEGAWSGQDEKAEKKRGMVDPDPEEIMDILCNDLKITRSNAASHLVLISRGLSRVLDMEARTWTAEGEFTKILEVLGQIECFNMRCLQTHLKDLHEEAMGALGVLERTIAAKCLATFQEPVLPKKIPEVWNIKTIRHKITGKLKEFKNFEDKGFKQLLLDRLEEICMSQKFRNLMLKTVKENKECLKSELESNRRSPRPNIRWLHVSLLEVVKVDLVQEIILFLEQWRKDLFTHVASLMKAEFGNIYIESAIQEVEHLLSHKVAQEWRRWKIVPHDWHLWVRDLSKEDFEKINQNNMEMLVKLATKRLIIPKIKKFADERVLSVVWGGSNRKVVLSTKLARCVKTGNSFASAEADQDGVLRGTLRTIAHVAKELSDRMVLELQSEEQVLEGILGRIRIIVDLLSSKNCTEANAEEFHNELVGISDDLKDWISPDTPEFQGSVGVITRANLMLKFLEAQLKELHKGSAVAKHGRRLVVFLRQKRNQKGETPKAIVQTHAEHSTHGFTRINLNRKANWIMKWKEMETMCGMKQKTALQWKENHRDLSFAPGTDVVRLFLELIGWKLYGNQRAQVKTRMGAFYNVLSRQAFRNGEEVMASCLALSDASSMAPLEIIQLMCDATGVSILFLAFDGQQFWIAPSKFSGDDILAYRVALIGFEQHRGETIVRPCLGIISPSDNGEIAQTEETQDDEEEQEQVHRSQNYVENVRLSVEAISIRADGKKSTRLTVFKSEISAFQTFCDLLQHARKLLLEQHPTFSFCGFSLLLDGCVVGSDLMSTAIGEKIVADSLEITLRVHRWGRLGVVKKGCDMFEVGYSGASEKLFKFQLMERARHFSHFLSRFEFLQGLPEKSNLRPPCEGIGKVLFSTGEDSVFSSRNAIVVLDGVSSIPSGVPKSAKQKFVRKLIMGVRLTDQKISKIFCQSDEHRNMARCLMEWSCRDLLRENNHFIAWTSKVTTTCTSLYLVNNTLHWYLRGDSLFFVVRLQRSVWKPIIAPKRTQTCVPDRKNGGRTGGCGAKFSEFAHECPRGKFEAAPQQFSLKDSNFHLAKAVKSVNKRSSGVIGEVDVEDNDIVIAASDGLWDALFGIDTHTEDIAIELCRLLTASKCVPDAQAIGNVLVSERHQKVVHEKGKRDDCGLVVAVVSRGYREKLAEEDAWRDSQSYPARYIITEAKHSRAQSVEEVDAMIHDLPISRAFNPRRLQSLSNRLVATADGRGLEIFAEDRDGHCGYRAIARQLSLLRNIDVSHVDLRERAVNELLKNDHYPRVEGEVERQGRGLEDARNGRSTGVWVNDVMLQILANVFNVKIVGFNVRIGDLLEVFSPEFPGNREVISIHIIYWDRLHFDSVVFGRDGGQNRLHARETIKPSILSSSSLQKERLSFVNVEIRKGCRIRIDLPAAMTVAELLEEVGRKQEEDLSGYQLCSPGDSYSWALMENATIAWYARVIVDWEQLLVLKPRMQLIPYLNPEL